MPTAPPCLPSFVFPSVSLEGLVLVGQHLVPNLEKNNILAHKGLIQKYIHELALVWGAYVHIIVFSHISAKFSSECFYLTPSDAP